MAKKNVITRTKMGLAVNEGKTKFMLSISSDVHHIDSILLRQSRNLFSLPSPLPPIMISVWRLNVKSLLPTGNTIISMVNLVQRPLLYDETN